MKYVCFLIGLIPACSLAQDLKAYQNYDFIAGNTILFTDDFSDSPTGELSPHWKLLDGQAVVNKVGDENAYFITKYYTTLAPRLKTPAYLPADFTVEFDTWLDARYDSNDGVYLALKNGEDTPLKITTNRTYVTGHCPESRLNGDLPKAIADDNYLNKWHHYAVAYRAGQLKVYCDQYRVLVMPDCAVKATSLIVGGDASGDMPMMFKNFRLATGGAMNLIGKAFTDGKYIAHGIHFDVNKASLKPESMGELNAIVNVLRENSGMKVQIAGYTDSDGDEATNLALSEGRAKTVRDQLVTMGIDAARLTTKGFGETKPIADNSTLEGKAQNRRVEFAKL